MVTWDNFKDPCFKHPSNICEAVEMLELALDELSAGVRQAEQMNAEDPPSPRHQTDAIEFTRMVTRFSQVPEGIKEGEIEGAHYEWTGHHDPHLHLWSEPPEGLYREVEAADTLSAFRGGELSHGVAADVSRSGLPGHVDFDWVSGSDLRGSRLVIRSVRPITRVGVDSIPSHDKTFIQDALVLLAKIRRRHGLSGRGFCGSARADTSTTVPKLYTIPTLRQLTGISASRTFARYTLQAGVAKTKRGQRHRKFTVEEVRAILQAVIDNSSEETLITKCRQSLKIVN
jgi:hypothetical protein